MENKGIASSSIAKLLDKDLQGKDVFVHKPASLASIENHCMVFANKYKDDIVEKLNHYPDVFAICHTEYTGKLTCAYVLSDNPRLDFIYALRAYFMPERKAEIHPTAYIEPGAQIGEGVSVGAFSYIGSDVQIGEGTEILEHVIITGKVQIGRDCRILEGACIGYESMGLERNEQGIPIEMPQLGGVRIGDRVKVAAGAKISRGALDDTIIGDDVKLDVNCGIAHNAKIGKSCIFTGSSGVGGSTTVGEKVYFGLYANVINGLKIGDGAYIGTGSTVIRDVKENSKVFGNPAREIRS